MVDTLVFLYSPRVCVCAGGVVHDIIHYYTSCDGEGPIAKHTDDIDKYTADLTNQTSSILQAINATEYPSCVEG